jgi:hypothetical protein
LYPYTQQLVGVKVHQVPLVPDIPQVLELSLLVPPLVKVGFVAQ